MYGNDAVIPSLRKPFKDATKVDAVRFWDANNVKRNGTASPRIQRNLAVWFDSLILQIHVPYPGRQAGDRPCTVILTAFFQIGCFKDQTKV